MNQRRSADVATVLAAIVVLIVGLTAVAFERGCGDARSGFGVKDALGYDDWPSDPGLRKGKISHIAARDLFSNECLNWDAPLAERSSLVQLDPLPRSDS